MFFVPGSVGKRISLLVDDFYITTFMTYRKDWSRIRIVLEQSDRSVRCRTYSASRRAPGQPMKRRLDHRFDNLLIVDFVRRR